MSKIEPKPKRLSALGIWQAQRNYYDETGIEAWSDEVPFYITSNPFIARSYAAITVRFIQDYMRQHPETANAPFYILELGAGTGQFSFYFLKALEEMLKNLKMKVDVRYVMTDFTESNVRFWSSHESLQPYLNQGRLDFAIFDALRSDTIELLHSQANVALNTLKNPLTLIANYLFDSLPCDFFHVKDKVIYEMHVKVSEPKKNTLAHWKKAKLSYDAVGTESPYEDQRLNAVLKQYAELFDNKHILFPSAALQLIQRIQDQSNCGLLLLTSDKGYDDIATMDDDSVMELDFHGSFSMMVNYDAMARYFKSQGGDYSLQCPRDAILTGIFLLGDKLSNLPETYQAVDQYNHRFSPADYFNLYEHVESFTDDCGLDYLASLLCLSGWGPGLYDIIFERMISLVEETEVDVDVLRYLSENIYQVADQYYFVPGSVDTLYNLGVFCQEIEAYDQALRYYERSRAHFEETWGLCFNEGTCYLELGDSKQALLKMEKALELDPDSEETQAFIKKHRK